MGSETSVETEADRIDGGLRRTLTALVAMLAAVAVLVALAVGRQPQSGAPTSMIRIANDTGLPLRQVRVNGVPFGDLPVGGISGYQPLTSAYRYASLRLVAAGTSFESIPDDYLGETPLGKGHFTYRIAREEVSGKPYFGIRVREHQAE
ncbi:hypothetical protein LQ564_14920 [Massilia sp. G4R7]|uniref:Uncharacterized protein n=1 Tax=Massilia phyllostachyos TaxID=2898585 RepID=A0ABS8Q783_9BURK|nr:hypothetical protein [Massilia phyllostachyos]MCD2517604.1 hypothetical protein [Massilia phyllostachyos]